MSTGNVHLIVTCTRRKTVPAGDAVFPDERDAESAYGLWLERLAQARRESPFLTAGELYTGQHWSRAAAAAARNGVEMWIISAGLGLLHVSDPVVPYEATFSSMPFCHRTHWERLTTRPPAERRCASLKTLMQAGPDDRFVVAASPVYLRAVESDLLAGRGALRTSEQLQVVTSKGYQGKLKDNVRYTSAGMMKALNTNMTGLNVSYALQLISR
ncbi:MULTISPECIES: DUF6884 domain-containing protein [Enterobacter cloacae complex]|uniref:DUF6884 domain-containing protein n=1 Tax=Enterobacter cloacae complex TaxID=354276 RepID=UPI0007501D2A|nr:MULTISPECIES: DUF6884 domain-containing protein [Enterobacter cloacae complex]HAY2086875.1 hypothetical protein [Escherichia coli]HEM7540741.1 hypothetical protein [Enterobacter hormaechei]KUQ76427.1 hypothetical protein AWI24_07585 [Enterobacter hormaechei subsp. steigerwaltii]SAF86709.1 Uncharacterised protein [Enterobacter kobei]HAY4545823.1 hypothetical protein [Escherichia coli]